MLDTQKTIHVGEQQLIKVAKRDNVTTVWDRYEAMQPQCGFGQTGLCCRFCWKGPCRIDPMGNGPKVGICGATADVIVARQLIRMQAAGAASHSEHGRHIALTLLEVGEGKAPAYRIKDEKKLLAIADMLSIPTQDKDIVQVAKEVAEKTLEDYSRQDVKHPCNWAKETLPPKRVDSLIKNGIMPHNIDAVVAGVLARTHVGCDSDAENIILGGLKAAMGDYTGMSLSTNLSDVLFGTPSPVVTSANLGVIKESAVNIAVHGHNPLLSEIVCDMAVEMNQMAKDAGAPDGINIMGICCTGNEVMMRHGVPLATNYLSQELAIVTGALEAMVVDVQCIMPSIQKVGESYHTEIITTMPDNKITGATHIEFDEHTAKESAKRIIRLAIDAYAKRDKNRISIPDQKATAIAGFSAEAVMDALGKVNAEDPLKPLIDNIVNGNIQGIALFAGCNSTQVTQDSGYVNLAKALAKKNVLMLATGCGAGALSKSGLMNQEATESYAGEGLKSVLRTVGEAAGLNGPLPLVLHMGSCVDNSRAIAVATAIAKKLDVDLSQLPVVASAPEAMSEKAVAIASWAVALGFPTQLGTVPQIKGSKFVTEFLTEKTKDITGGYFIAETNQDSAAEKMFEAIQERRRGLGI
jgi:carbon-monoxide dehydrogenase catalytic subunit